MIRFRVILFLFLFLFSFSSLVISQEAGMDFLNYPNSISSIGLGQNSVAFPDNDGAFVFNPANLIFIDKPELSFYRRQFAFMSSQLPITSVTGYFDIPNVGSFGVEYFNQNYGEFVATGPEGPEIIGRFQAFNRSISAGFARSFSDNFSAGISLRYAWSRFFSTSIMKHLFISLGLNYNPDIFSNNFNIGFSLTNFGNAIESNFGVGTSEAPAPAKFNLGINYTLFNSKYFSAGAHLAISKYLITNRDENNREVKSSFAELFSDWKDFPEDVNTNIGLFYEWNPLNIGNDFSFFQKFYIGNQSNGIKSGGGGFFTHGAQFGIEYDGYRFTAGYTGIWHLVHNPYFINQFLHFPMESFQFTFGINESIISGSLVKSNSPAEPKNIILSLGTGYSMRIGKYKKFDLMETSNNASFYLEGDFYLNKRNALVSSISYYVIPFKYMIRGFLISETKVETFVFTSQYRYHLFEGLTSFYLQGGLGIVRFNPRENTSPKYDYKTTLHLAVGDIVDILDPLVINPEIFYTLLFNTEGTQAPRLGGFNQFDAVLKLGYRF